MTTTATTGLRARKRGEVRLRLQDAAVFLVLRDGLEGTTVDAISERAGVSPRTFFNYFESKDSALLGLHQDDLTDELVADHLAMDHDVSLVSSVLGLLLSILGAPSESAGSLHRDRVEVIRRHPQVLASQFTQLSARAGRLTDAIEDLLARSPGTPEAGGDRRALAEMLLAVCGGAIRIAVREWAGQGAPSAVEDIERRALALIDSTTRSLT